MEYRPLLFVLFTALLVSTPQALKLDVGGTDGWTLNPSENYNSWSGRNRFLINDVIVFKYKKGSDSVLEVKKEDYEKCNKTNPIKKFEDGETEFTLDRAGPFYFISGKDENCEKGQKLTLVVISPRKNTSPSVPTPSSSPPSPSVPAGGPKASSPPSVSTPPAGGPTTSPPSPVTTPPASGPKASTPSPVSTSPSPTSVSTPPAGGPTASSPSPSPFSVSTPPAGGPTASSPSPSPFSVSTPPAGGPTGSSSPTGAPMAGGPSGSLAPGPGGVPTSQSPGSSTDAKAPSSSGSYVGPSSFVVCSIAVVVGALFLSY
ncbi:hypothetical protein P8452_70305 [Trifolium repens]|nr:hypothetical protein P8452_70305 [Trifolium repens]